jgi:hypothetical protein
MASKKPPMPSPNLNPPTNLERNGTIMNAQQKLDHSKMMRTLTFEEKRMILPYGQRHVNFDVGSSVALANDLITYKIQHLLGINPKAVCNKPAVINYNHSVKDSPYEFRKHMAQAEEIARLIHVFIFTLHTKNEWSDELFPLWLVMYSEKCQGIEIDFEAILRHMSCR